MLCGGERLTQALAARLLDGGGVLWNMYGPTETTVWSIVERVTDADSIDFGKPIANTTCVVLDEAMNPLPAGIPGELCIGGAGLARGYHRRDALTAEKFVVPAYDGAERLYRTGDRAVLRPDGRLVLLGRLDDQVKLRGYRIELGEVEAAIFRATGGKQNAVRLIEPAEGDAYLAAYIEGGLAASDGMDKLRQALSLDLPGWMVPTRIVGLEKLPRTANNKLDRKALPVPVATTMRIVTPPRTPLEQKLLAIWQEVLGQRDIGVTDALFSLGADSIQAFRIVARADREGLEFDAAMLLRLRTIEALAQHLVSVVPTPAPAIASDDPLPTAIRKPSGPAIRRASREAFRIDTRS
jgi:aryl carrier-like protein